MATPAPPSQESVLDGIQRLLSEHQTTSLGFHRVESPPDLWRFTDALPPTTRPAGPIAPPAAIPPSFGLDRTPRLRSPEEREILNRELLFGGLLLWLALVWMLPRRQPIREEGALEPGEAMDRLRAWSGLSVADIADLLGVARRSLYHWSTGTTRPRHADRLLGLVRLVEPMSRSWEPWEMRQWLTRPPTRELVRSGDIGALGKLVDEAVRPSAMRRLQPARADYREEVEPLESDALRSHFITAVRPRVASKPFTPYVPRELTDSPWSEEA